LLALPSITALRSNTAKAQGRRDAVAASLASVTTEIDTLENDEELLTLVSALFRKLIDQEVTEGVKAVEHLQTEGLQAVFDDQDISVKAAIEESRGKVSVELVTVQKKANGDIIEGVAKDDFGGSVLTVQSVLLRVIIMLRRGHRPLLLLDESLPAFDANYIANMGNFLSELCKRLDIDILMVTHNPALFDAADRSYRIVRKSGESKFERVR
tara:strand:+ start:11180 stop:11815 length:636 start_codon:yes stop_codon:yes gene_type:complete